MPKQDFPKTYSPQATETKIYDFWLKHKYFKPENGLNTTKKTYTIPMPPPNLTGNLHLGHIMGVSIEDILIRYHRQLGDETLYLPGTDHAALSLQILVEKELTTQGLNPHTMPKAEFLTHCWAFANKYKDNISQQFRKAGVSADWERNAFTLSPELSTAVQKAFITLYNEGYIYRDNRLSNWCPHDQTSLSDLETVHTEQTGKLWYITYFVSSTDKNITIATTRPETMLGDTAIAVHPKDKRYKTMIGRNAIIPVINRKIPIIADPEVDMYFGTGAVKITPAHDAFDFKLAQKHELPMIQVIDKNAKMTPAAGADFAGLTTTAARQKLINMIDDRGNLEKIEDITHNILSCERCGTPLEPLIMTNWFMKMDKLTTLVHDMITKKEIEFIPAKHEKITQHWLNNTPDWCLSRQIHWGHPIPAWYKDGQIKIQATAPDNSWQQDPDTLDTWFSSGLWPFSMLGWPQKTPDLKKFYPTQFLDTGYDILPFWVIRMLFFGKKFTGKAPFKTIYLHGMFRDENGKKMSKSKGNGIDPTKLINTYGSDAVRFSTIFGNTTGGDVNLALPRLAGNRNFVNKIWNASRYIYLSLTTNELNQDYDKIRQEILGNYKKLDPASLWILQKLQTTIKTITTDLDQHRLPDASNTLYSFIWNDFCDWYLEIAKTIDPTQVPVHDILTIILIDILKLSHPFLPFVSEEIWQKFNFPKALIISPWPEYNEKILTVKNTQIIEVMEIIQQIRAQRAEKKVAPNQKISLFIHNFPAAELKQYEKMLINMAHIAELKTTDKAIPDSIIITTANYEIYLPLLGLIDLDQEQMRLNKELKSLINFQGAINNKLSNKAFCEKAPREIIFTENQKLLVTKAKIAKITAQLAQLAQTQVN